MQINVDKSLTSFGETVSEALRVAFREWCTSTLEITVASQRPESLLQPEQSLWFAITIEGSLRGRAYIGVKETDIPALGLRDAPASQENAKASLLSVLKTMEARLQESAGITYGAIDVTVEHSAMPALPDAGLLELTVRSEAGEAQATLNLCLERQLVHGLQSSAGLFPEPVPPTSTGADNLELVLDVELHATLRFGQRQLPLREILDLTSGSVVELDRQVDEPVELILDGRVIARGEAVIIDGNYGMRIMEILQPVHGLVCSR